jgi:hypothetical protein
MLDRISRDRVVWRQAVAQIVAALISLGLIGAGVGVDVIDTTDNVLEVWIDALPLVQTVAALLGAAWAKARVTPADDPRTAAGTPLVPDGTSPMQ